MGAVCELKHVRVLDSEAEEDSLGRIVACPEGSDANQQRIRDALVANGLKLFQFLDRHVLSYEKFGFIPWAMLLWEKEMLIAEEIHAVRRNRSDLLISGYSIAREPGFAAKHRVIPVSIVLVKNKAALEYAMQESMIFQDAWESLRDAQEKRYWICLCEELLGAIPYNAH